MHRKNQGYIKYPVNYVVNYRLSDQSLPSKTFGGGAEKWQVNLSDGSRVAPGDAVRFTLSGLNGLSVPGQATVQAVWMWSVL
jgi:hypothetical protein